MKEFYSQVNRKLYYIFMLIIIVLMIAGLVLLNSRFEDPGLGYLLHVVLVIVLSVCLTLYPQRETHTFRMLIILFGSAYFYTLFFLYPETWSNFILLCLIPAISILFFDSKLFYCSFLLNGLLIIMTFVYIVWIDQGVLYPYISQDVVGNFINIGGSQVLLFLIFHVSFKRVKKQQHYYEQLQQSERLKMIGQLTAVVAHEIRNPVTVVKGYLQFYKGDPSFSNSIKNNFNLMIDELNTVEQVVSQFLTLAKPDKDQKLEKVDVKDVLQSVTGLLNSYAMLYDNQMDINVEKDCFISVNKIEFKQLVINLMKNAIEASSVGKSVLVTAIKHNESIEIKIIDEGNGMSAEELKFLGNPFYSLKSNGTGLGLMICFNIVEKYDGAIHFSSSEGRGTTVTVRFPAARDY